MKFFLTAPMVSLVLSLSMWPFVAWGKAAGFDLKETLRYALDHSPNLKSSRDLLEIAHREKSNALAQFFPSLDFSATHGISDASPSSNTTAPWSSALSLGLTETLYDNGAQWTAYQLSRTEDERSELAHRNTRDQLCLEVIQAYHQFSLAHRLAQVEGRLNDILKRQLKSITQQYHQGFKTRQDYLRFETQVRRSEIDLIDSKNRIEKTRLQLLQALGVPLADGSPSDLTFRPDDDTKVNIPDFQKDPPRLSEHYEFKIAELQKEKNDRTTDLTRRKWWPQVSLTGGVSYDNSKYLGGGSSPTGNDSLSWNILVTLQYNLWDWGTRARNVEIADLRRDVADQTLDQQLFNVRTQIRGLLLDLKRLKENFQLSEELLKLEKNSYQLLEAEYRRGKVPYLDLITGLKDLSEAEGKYYTSLFELKTGIYQYWYQKGKLYETLF